MELLTYLLTGALAGLMAGLLAGQGVCHQGAVAQPDQADRPQRQVPDKGFKIRQ